MSLFKSINNLIFDEELKKKIDFLKKVSIFKNLNRNTLGKVLSIAYEKKYAKGEEVFHEGKVGKALYIIKSGKISIVKGNKTLSELSEGEFFGEMALIEEIPRSANALVYEDCSLLLIYKVKFDSLLKSSPAAGLGIVLNLSKILSMRLRGISENYVKHTQ